MLRRKRGFKSPVDNPVKPAGNSPGKNDGLTPTEHRLITCLALNAGKTIDYARLIGEVWGGKQVSLDNLHFYVRRLRQKLSGFGQSQIIGCHGIGYRFEKI